VSSIYDVSVESILTLTMDHCNTSCRTRSDNAALQLGHVMLDCNDENELERVLAEVSVISLLVSH
jgi:hypothetical protein